MPVELKSSIVIHRDRGQVSKREGQSMLQPQVSRDSIIVPGTSSDQICK